MTFLTSVVEVRSLANIADYSPGAIYGPRVMSTHEFVWLLTGSATWEILGRDGRILETHKMTPGVMALATRGSAERWRWDPARSSSHAFVHFDLPAQVDASEWPRTRMMSECHPMAVLADSLFDLGAADEALAQRRSAQVIGLMLEIFFSEPAARSKGRATALVDRAGGYVGHTWRERGVRIVGVAELARALGVSSGHLSRSFHEVHGIGPAAALELVRLARAAVALQRTSRLLAEIASELGFSDEFHLSKRFARVYGVPPGAYRRRHGGDEPLQPIIQARLMSLWNAAVTPSPNTYR